MKVGILKILSEVPSCCFQRTVENLVALNRSIKQINFCDCIEDFIFPQDKSEILEEKRGIGRQPNKRGKGVRLSNKNPG